MSQTDARHDWLFILGCQRSGTTLLRLLLECHSRIECVDEARSYRLIAGQIEIDRNRPLLALKIPCLTEQLAQPTWWDFRLLQETPNLYRGQPLIFLVRDVRDTVASMFGLRFGKNSWFDAWLVPSLHAKQRREPEFVRRYDATFARIEQSRHPRLARAAFYWQYKVNALFDYLSRGFPLLLIRYEDLVTQPGIELLRLCGFLGVPWEPRMLSHEATAHAELDQNGCAIGNTCAARPIDRDSVHRWRETFSAEEAEEILAFAGEPQEHLYSTSTTVRVSGGLPL